MQPPASYNREITIDKFTQRVQELYLDLVRRGAFAKKKHFTDALHVTASYFNFIEKNQRNYPDDENKKKLAKADLLDKFGVNPEYLDGRSDKKYLREPQRVETAPALEVVSINFRDKKEKQHVLEERDMYKKKYEECQQELAIVMEKLKAYETKSTDKPTDKTPDKK